MNKKEIIKQGIKLYNKHYPNDKHTTKKEKENFVKFFIGLHKVTNSNSNLADKTIKVLQSKVKCYEQDIEEVNKEKYKTSLRSANDLKGTTKLF
tara:strand:+ start:418 stop:699 length:282 start_codon:yes stop_codon:yes gene_type:complete